MRMSNAKTLPPLVRHVDWPQRLAAFVERRRATPFAWGQQDCCTFAADAVVCMTGTDPMADLRHLNSAAAATRYLSRHPLPELVSERLGRAGPATLAQRGDVVLIEQQGRQLLGVCLGAQWAAPGEHGLVFGPMVVALEAWQVRGGD